METIIVKPGNSREYREVISFLKKIKVKAEVYQEPSKEQVLKSIEKGAKSAAAFIRGKKKLKEAKALLRES